jgi:hypothetical protein
MTRWTFDVPLEDRVIDLDGGDGGNGYGAAYRGGGDSREPNVSYLTFAVKELH